MLTKEEYLPIKLSPKEVKAIHKQMSELRWLDADN